METAVDHWRFPGWWSLALAGGIGLVTPLLALVIAWATRRIGLVDESVHRAFSPWLGLALTPLSVFFEEWIFRGMVLRLLVKPLGAVAAVMISSALFALAHLSLAGCRSAWLSEWF